MIDKDFNVTGRLIVRIKDKHGRVIDTIEGPNAVMSRAKFVLSRLLGGANKTFTTGSFGTIPQEWPQAGDSYPDSLIYPFSTDNNLVTPGYPTTDGRVINNGYTWGGVTNDYDLMNNLNLNGKQNDSNIAASGGIFHRGTNAIGSGVTLDKSPNWSPDGDLTYGLNITGMAFGNGGHLMYANGQDQNTCYSSGNLPDGAPAGSATYHPGETPTNNLYTARKGYFPSLSTDLSKICCNTVDSLDIFGRPAQPGPNTNNASYDYIGYNPDYTEDTNIPGSIYEEVENGIVPATGSALGDNWAGVEEPNSTLYSETMRLPLDPIDGVSFPDYKSVKFKCTIPADSELNQARRFGYSRRLRNIITEAALISGENVLVQSPDPRVKAGGSSFADVSETSIPDTTTRGTSNVNGAQLAYSSNGIASGWWSGNFYSVPKDYFTKVRDVNDINEYMFNPLTAPTEYSRVKQGNNTWNMFARRVFGGLTKTPEYEMEFLWIISF